jgi:GT2 family glycosyltransferase
MSKSSYSVVIPSNRNIVNVIPTLQSLDSQIIKPDTIYIVYDRILTQPAINEIQEFLSKEFDDDFMTSVELVTHLTYDFRPGQGVSYVRNYPIHIIKSDFVLFVDDDNTFMYDFTQTLINISQEYHTYHNNYPILIPSERRHGHRHSHGYRSFNYVLGIQNPAKPWHFQTYADHKCFSIQFSSSNCLRMQTKTAWQYPFNESMTFTYEDFEMTRRATRNGIAMLCVYSLAIQHHIRPKTPLEKTYIDHPDVAYNKARNRIRFVRYTATKFQLIIYITLGLWSHTIFLLLKVRIYAPFPSNWRITRAILRGTRDSLLYTN